MFIDIPLLTVSLPEQFNAASYFLDRHLAEGRGERTAIYYEGNAYTYAQIAEQANRVGSGLSELGIEMEQRVALILLDSPAFAASFFGALKLGAVPVPMNTMLRPDDYIYLLNDCRAKVLCVHAELWRAIRHILPRLLYLRHVVVVGLEQSGERENATCHDFELWLRRASPDLKAARTSKDDSAFWLYSSGSTGFPKGCVHLHHDMTYCCEYYAKPILQINERDICFSASKLFFAYGFGNGLYFPFAVGASAVHYPGRPQPEAVFQAIEQYRPTIFFGSPALYANMLASGKSYDLSSLRLCVSAGEALPADIWRRWQQRYGVEILDGIGSTEILHIFISNRTGEVRPGSTGKIVPGYEARIVDERGAEVAPGEMGTLLIRGDSTAACYWNKHEKTLDTMRGRWIATGDTYTQDADGYYWYGGRVDDMLKVNGLWVSPAEVEGALMAHPAVLQAAIVGAADQDELIKPRAYIVLQSDHEPSETLVNELKTFVKARLASFKAPQWIEFVSELPMTATGKIQRFVLREASRPQM
ncbi:benzoate-CoA ligase family protein [Ktedonospora formicarum]|uniref:Acetyl-CoA synthetase n=1 Tax=Ktedonospora formicarum TaxID=2778364 RepID=A0A8J3MXB9_9CHLR|nr:benzoate-CoA ligase family protein [Ktedonospora formicarum]GHO49588.1 acetyl-CoA synthetase [Ktedonospora formicarum]